LFVIFEMCRLPGAGLNFRLNGGRPCQKDQPEVPILHWIFMVALLASVIAFVAAVFRYQSRPEPGPADLAMILAPLAIGAACAWQLQRTLSTSAPPGIPAATATAMGRVMGTVTGTSSATAAATSIPAAIAKPLPDGAAIYRSRCASCHGATGLGLPGAIPPIAGAEIANGPADAHVKVVVDGMRGPIQVKGKPYNGTMPPFKDLLSAEEIAAVVTYERSSFGNGGGAVDAASVVKLGGRAAP
jgi:mono/diheme cytochrome c family protein